MNLTSQTDGGGGLYRIGTMLLALLVASSILAAPAMAAGDVTISVEDGNGDAVDGATVTLYNDADDTEAASDTTGSGGDVTFSSQTDGDFYAEVSADGYSTGETGTITVSGSAVTETVTLSEEPDLINETVSIDGDTQTVWAEITADSETDVSVTFTGVNSSDDSSAELSSSTVTVSADSTEIVDYSLTDSDLETHDEVDVVATGVNDDVNATDYGKTVSVSGGGGGSAGDLLGYSIYGIPAVAILLVVGAGAFILTRY